MADPPVGDSATATPSERLRKPVFLHDRHPLPNFLDPPLADLTIEEKVAFFLLYTRGAIIFTCSLVLSRSLVDVSMIQGILCRLTAFSAQKKKERRDNGLIHAQRHDDKHKRMYTIY